MKAHLHGTVRGDVGHQLKAGRAFAPLPSPDRPVAVAVIPHRAAVFTGVVGQTLRQHGFGVRGLFLILSGPCDALEIHVLEKAAVRAAHPKIEAGTRLLGERLPDRAVLRGRGRDFHDLAPGPPCRRALLRQRLGRCLVFRVLVLVQLVEDEDADGLVPEPRDGTGPAEVNRHVQQVDAQAGGIVPVARHVLPEARGGLDHRDDAVLGVLAGGQFVGEHVHDRAGETVDAVPDDVVATLRAARLGALADDDRLDAGKPGHVHDPGEVRREHVPPAAPDGRHFEDAVFLRPCADRHGPAALHRGPLPF